MEKIKLRLVLALVLLFVLWWLMPLLNWAAPDADDVTLRSLYSDGWRAFVKGAQLGQEDL
jgi:hypothetical protein